MKSDNIIIEALLVRCEHQHHLIVVKYRKDRVGSTIRWNRNDHIIILTPDNQGYAYKQHKLHIFHCNKKKYRLDTCSKMQHITSLAFSPHAWQNFGFDHILSTIVHCSVVFRIREPVFLSVCVEQEGNVCPRTLANVRTLSEHCAILILQHRSDFRRRQATPGHISRSLHTWLSVPEMEGQSKGGRDK